MFRTALIALAAAATVAATAAAAQTASPVRSSTRAEGSGPWSAPAPDGQPLRDGLRSDAAAPQPGKPQFMITAETSSPILRVRAAEWSFAGARDIESTLVTANGAERQPAAAVRGKDLIDIAFGTEPERLAELAELEPSGDSRRRDRRSACRSGAFRELPAYRHCLAGIGQPADSRTMPCAVALMLETAVKTPTALQRLPYAIRTLITLQCCDSVISLNDKSIHNRPKLLRGNTM